MASRPSFVEEPLWILKKFGVRRGFFVGVAEWSNALDCKSSDRMVYEGSNPSPSTMVKNKIQTFLENEPLIINWENIDILKKNKVGSLFLELA